MVQWNIAWNRQPAAKKVGRESESERERNHALIVDIGSLRREKKG